LNTTGTYYSDRKTAANGCDSIVVLTLTVNQAYNLTRSAVIEKAQLPFTYACREFAVGTVTGIYEVACTTVAGCDSIIMLDLTVNGSSGLISPAGELFSLSPNPSKRGDFVNVNYDFNPLEQKGLKVEVFNNIGVCVAVLNPTAYPIGIETPGVSGIYLVRITTGTNKLIFGKFMVQ
jgi:hypothetical protein